MKNTELANLLKLANQKKSALETLTEYIDALEARNEKLQQQLEAYSEEEAVAHWKEKYEDTFQNSLHVLSATEREEAKAFAQSHLASCKSNVRYEILGTGIGSLLVVGCVTCKNQKDITDIDQW